MSLHCKGLCWMSCGIIMIPNEKQVEKIREYCEKHGMTYFDLNERAKRFFRGEKMSAFCPYLVNKRCSIYPVRPAICRLFGIVKELACPFGCTPSEYISHEDAKKLIFGDPVW